MKVGGLERNLRQIIQMELWTHMTGAERSEFNHCLQHAMNKARTVRRRRYYATWFFHLVDGHAYAAARGLALTLYPPELR